MSNTELLSKWESDMIVNNLSSGTIKNYLCQVKLFIKYTNHKSLLEINKDDIKRFISTVNKPTSRDTKQRYLKSFFDWLVSEDGGNAQKECNPFNSGTIKIKKPKRLPDYFIKEEIDKINHTFTQQIKESESRWRFGPIQVINGIRQKTKVHYDKEIYNAHRDRLAFNLMIATGVRKEELVTLKVENFDLISYTPSVRVIGKGDKERLIPFQPKYANMIQKFIEKFGITNGYLFKGDEDNHWSTAGVDWLFGKLEKIVDREINPHMTRHTYGVHFLNTKDKDGRYGNLEDLQELMGHADISTTQIYTHVGKERLKAEARKFAPNF